MSDVRNGESNGDSAVPQPTDPLSEGMLARLSHELRNPLMAIASASEVLRDDEGSSAAARQATAVVLEHIEHLAHLLDEMLDAASARRHVSGPSGPGPTRDEPSDSSKPPTERRHVLLVEDQDDVRELMQMLLTRRGLDVHAVRTVAQAKQALAREGFDVAIIDLGLPDGTGLEVARAARGSGSAPLQLIALTGHGQASDRAATRAAGFDHHVVKPVDVSALVELIEAGLG